MTEREKIIEFAQKKFFAEGFYKTTMAEIASDLRMSKKTIYKHFSSKEELVIETTSDFRKKMAAKIKIIFQNNDNAVIKFTKLINHLAKMTTQISDKWIDDLSKHLPKVWESIDRFRTEMMLKNLSRLIEQGKNEGLFVDIPGDIIVPVILNAVRSIVNPDFIMNSSYSIKQAINFTFQILLNGILTEEGKKFINEQTIGMENED
jgi:AcrR family transcriptional regulator